MEHDSVRSISVIRITTFLSLVDGSIVLVLDQSRGNQLLLPPLDHLLTSSSERRGRLQKVGLAAVILHRHGQEAFRAVSSIFKAPRRGDKLSGFHVVGFVRYEGPAHRQIETFILVDIFGLHPVDAGEGDSFHILWSSVVRRHGTPFCVRPVIDQYGDRRVHRPGLPSLRPSS